MIQHKPCINCPDKTSKARGLCSACYARQLNAENPYVKLRQREAEARYRSRSWAKCLEATKKWRATHPEQVAKTTKEWRAKNCPRIQLRRLERYQNNRTAEIQYARDWNFRKRYGISLEERDRMIAEQNNCCAACNKPFHGTRGKLCPMVHHSHEVKTPHVIAILHGRCNIAMGQVG